MAVTVIMLSATGTLTIRVGPLPVTHRVSDRDRVTSPAQDAGGSVRYRSVCQCTVMYFDYTISCTLRAAVRQLAPAGCRALARGEARWLRRHLDSCRRIMSYVRRTTSYNTDVAYYVVRQARMTSYPYDIVRGASARTTSFIDVVRLAAANTTLQHTMSYAHTILYI
jgi:hypothetical protein